MKKRIIYIFTLFIIISCGAPKNGTTKGDSKESAEIKKEIPKKPATIKMVDIPTTLVNNEDRLEFAITRFWDNVDFKDTLYISEKNIFEQGFADYINIIIRLPNNETSKSGMELLLKKAEIASDRMFNHVITLCEKYLHDPNSPARNETQYINVLNYIIKSDSLDSLSKVRPKYQLEMALKNRPGNKANNFKFNMIDGSKHSFNNIESEYTILFFYNLGCPMCNDVKAYIANSPILNNKNIKIVSIYPDKDKEGWEEQANTIPKEWINGIVEDIDNLYDVNAIPSLHLLDRNKIIILKDAPIEHIENHLGEIL